MSDPPSAFPTQSHILDELPCGPLHPGTSTCPFTALLLSLSLSTAPSASLSLSLPPRWNASVFGGRLPAGLPLIWNPRLLSTAGQVLDDGSRNREKADPEE